MATKKKFTPEEIKNLKANPYTLRVTEDTISYTLAFKEAFWDLSVQGYTYIPLNGAFCYLSTILDACTKQVLAYVLSESLEVDFVLETVNLLVKNHGVSLNRETLIHSDQGAHYTSLKFIQLVKDSNLRQSMSRRGNCWDNAPQESFFGHMKDELAGELPGRTSFEAVKSSIDRWMDYYNNDRYQWDLAKLSPNEYYNYITTGEYPVDMLPPYGSN